MCGDWSEAEDLVQDVLIKVYLRWDRIASLEHPEAYVRRMLVNEHLSWRRRLRRRPVPAEGLPESTVNDPSQELEDRDLLRASLAALPRRQRTVLALRYYDGLSDGDIAVALGCSPGTVRGHASRALSRLRAVIEPTDRQTMGQFHDRH